VEASRAFARRAADLARCCHAGQQGTAFQAEAVRIIHALLPVDAVFLPRQTPRRCWYRHVGRGAHWSVYGSVDDIAVIIEPAHPSRDVHR
jgi:hypothetical protein